MRTLTTQSTKRMRVVFLINSLTKLGPVNVLESLVSALDRERFEPTIICLRFASRDGNDRVFRELGVPIISLNQSLWSLELRTKYVAKMVRCELVKLDAQLVHTHGYHPDIVGSYLAHEYKCISTQHNISYEDSVFSKGQIVGTYMHYRLWHSLKPYTCLVGISAYVTKYIEQQKSGVRAETILNGIDLSRFAPLECDARHQARVELGIPPGSRVFVVCGSLTPLKRPLFIISAFTRWLSDMPLEARPHLILIGAGRQEQACREAIKGYERQIHLLGFRSDPERYIGLSDYLITASESEGFGLNVGEALASGLRVLASDLDVFRELASYAPKGQILFFNTEDELLELLRRSSAERAEPSAEPIPSLGQERMAREYARLYAELIEGIEG